MNMCRSLLIALVLVLLGGVAQASSDQSPEHLFVNNSNIASLSQFLEQYPLDKYAFVVRGEALLWEQKSKDVVDMVYPCLFKPVPSETIRYSSILLAQFIIGSAAFQIANPSQKGQLLAQQLAGTESMLRAYQAILAKDPGAHIAHFDDLSQQEAKGTLAAAIRLLMVPKCD